MTTIARRWVIYTVASIGFGFMLGFVLAYLWFFFSLVFFRYGDSGPAWVNIMNDLFFYCGLGIGIVGGQLLFFCRDRVNSLATKLAKRKRLSR